MQKVRICPIFLEKALWKLSRKCQSFRQRSFEQLLVGTPIRSPDPFESVGGDKVRLVFQKTAFLSFSAVFQRRKFYAVENFFIRQQKNEKSSLVHSSKTDLMVPKAANKSASKYTNDVGEWSRGNAFWCLRYLVAKSPLKKSDFCSH